MEFMDLNLNSELNASILQSAIICCLPCKNKIVFHYIYKEHSIRTNSYFVRSGNAAKLKKEKFMLFFQILTERL